MRWIKCALCDGENFRVLYRIPDINYSTSSEKFTYVECENCGLVFQNPQLEPEELSKYYPENYSCYQVNSSGSNNSKINSWLTQIGFNKRWNFVLSEVTKGKLLDIGCATGNFLYHQINNKSWELIGLEVNKSAIKIARSRGLNVLEGSIDIHTFEKNVFDVVTLWDVLEHLNDPKKALSDISCILKPEGLIILRIPRLDSWDYQVFRQNWHGFESPRHLYLFTKATISNFLHETGFTQLKASGEFGSYMTIILDLKFWLISKGLSQSRVYRITNLLYNPITRLIFSPVFAIIGLLFHGPSITIVARKKNN